MTVKGKDQITISYLPEMLEGQVAVLSSGFLSSSECLEVLDINRVVCLELINLVMCCHQYTRLAKNAISSKAISGSNLLTKLIKDKNSQVVDRDVLGKYHFNGNFNNINSLKTALQALLKIINYW